MKRFIIITITALFSVLVLYLGDKTDILSTSKLESYVKKFNKSDNELYPQHISNISTLEFLSKNIPLIELPNKELEEKKIPFIIRRPLPNGGSEYWNVSDLELLE